MSTNDDGDHLADLLGAAKEAQEYLGASSKAEFRLNHKDRDSVNYKFIVMGEAANRLGPDFHRRHPAIPWSDLIGMRNIVAHQYGRVDPDIVWETVKARLPAVIQYLEPLVRGPGNDDTGNDGKGGPGGGTGGGGPPPPVPNGKPPTRPGPGKPPSPRKSDGWER